MLRLADLAALSPLLNIKELCTQAGLSYHTTFAKMKREQSGKPHRSELSVTESEKLTAALTRFGITVDAQSLHALQKVQETGETA